MKKVDFGKLNKVPYMKNFSDNPKFQEWVNEYIDFWESQTPEALDSVALIRAVECTNGCVQYAFRDGEEWALSLEQTRLCMKTSMGFIKSKKLELPDGRVIECDPSVTEALNFVRDIYIEGFKNGNDEKVMQFYAQSVAQFYVLGRDRLTKQLDFVSENLGQVFGEDFLNHGRNYIFAYLGALENEL